MYISVRDSPAGRASRRPSSAPEPTPPTHSRHRVAPVVVTLGLVSLLTDISSESVAAILPLYLTASLGLSTVAYGFVDALYQGVSSLVRMAGGWAADRGGHPKWVAFAGYGISCAARFALLFGTGLAVISAVVATDRVGKGIRTAPRDAMISAATPPEHLGQAFGVHRTLDTIGAVLGPLIAFALLWWIPDGYLTVMLVSFGFAVLGVALLGLFVPDRVAELPPTPAPSPTVTPAPTPTHPLPGSAGKGSPSRTCSSCSPLLEGSRCSRSATGSCTSRSWTAASSPPTGSPSCTSARTSRTWRSPSR